MNLEKEIDELNLNYFNYLPLQKILRHEKKEISESELINEMLTIINKICSMGMRYTIDENNNILLH